MSFYTRRKCEEYKSNDSAVMPPPPELKWNLPTRGEIGLNRCEMQSPTHVLLITVNDCEFNACYSYITSIRRSYHKDLGYVDFGEFGNENVKVALMRCGQGPMEAVIAVKNAADILNPKVVLFVGICASMKPEKAKLGDVVISAKLVTYAEKEIRQDGTNAWRGTKANISKNMSRLILSAADGWQPPLVNPDSFEVEVHRNAVMLSGPELVNNLRRRQELLNYFKDLLGLEMEGAGLYAGAYDLGIEWAVIKGVSSFADGNEEETERWQPFASVMAASVVHNMFKHPDVLQSWRHFKNFDSMPRTTGATNTTAAVRSSVQEDQMDQSRTIASCPFDDFLQRDFGISGRIKYKDRMIVYTSRMLNQPKDKSQIFEAEAKDKLTGITVTKENLRERSNAIKYTLKALLEKLQELNLVD